MADFYGSHFEYGYVSSRQYGLIIVNIDTDRITQLGGNTESVSFFNKKAKKRYFIDDDYSVYPLSFDIEVITDNQRCLEQSEIREIEKWLFNRREYRRLYLDVGDDCCGDTFEYVEGIMKRNYLNCRLVNPSKIEGSGGIVGFRATLEADSGLLWQDAIEKSFSIGNAYENVSSIVTVDVDSDADDYIYPKVTITMGGVGGDVIIINNSDDETRMTKFIEISPYATITMNGELNYISGQYYEKFNKQNFIRLLDGANRLTVLGNVDTLEVEFSNRRAL